ncbi:glycosyltransferase [Flavobacterium sp. TP390]|uniref:Glycosyltransferase n=1 Tax=Flavobacterium profundi TaxID=1774945 RepID=A0A6I4IL13_9FLAO|nr:glycosyltransferase [Flavobacterium profundi]MVO08931.1 glycosyltransferase [Flavobacterium profundi]
MKTGIIIICHNQEKTLDTLQCVQHIHHSKNIEFCFVNNNSNDNTYELLKEISEVCQNVSVVNINKYKKDISAIRAGARFMFDQFTIQYLGFVTADMIGKYENLSQLLAKILNNQLHIVSSRQSFLKQRKMKLTLFQSLFPISDYLE